VPLENVFDYDSYINALYSPGLGVWGKGTKPSDIILQHVVEEESLILISVYSFTNFSSPVYHNSIGNFLADALRRGVVVVGVTDYEASVTNNDSFIENLRGYGIPFYECINPGGPFNAMHCKNGLFGLGKSFKIVSDTGNWSQDSLGSEYEPADNDESFLFFNCTLADIQSSKNSVNKMAYEDCVSKGYKFLSNFLFLLRTYQFQPNNTDQPNYLQILKKLQSIPQWPPVTVDFEINLNSSENEVVFLAGNSSQLGNWNQSFPGVKLVKSHHNKEMWTTPSPIEWPFGTIVEFKFFTMNTKTGEIIWETGPDRIMVVDPALAIQGNIFLLHFIEKCGHFI